MTTLTSSLIVKLVDQVSAPARAVSRSLLGLNNSVKGGFGARLGDAIARNNAALDSARGRIVDAAAGFYVLQRAIGAPINAAANFETALEDIGQKLGTPQQNLAALGEDMKRIAGETNQATSSITASFDSLVSRGASEEVALAAAGPIGKAATAYRAATDDLAAASYAAVDNLKVSASDIGTVLDMMAQAGKEGAFELKDMATYFPQLAAAYQGAGQTGTDAVADLAAALQIVRKGTGDSSTAATNLQNVIQKMASPATIRAFKKMGVDLGAALSAAGERGLTPIEAIAEITNETLNGDLSKLGFLFEDAQAQAGIRSLIQGMEEYKRIRASAMDASGVVDTDFERRLTTAQGIIDRWKAMLENLSISVGTTLLPLLRDVLDHVTPIIGKIGSWAAANPGLARGLVAAAAGAVAFKVAIAGFSFVGLLGKGGALAMLSLGFSTVGKTILGASAAAKGAVGLQAALAAMSGANFGGLAKLGVAIRGIAMAVPGVAMIGSALTAIGTAIGAVSLPVLVGVGAAIAAVAGAGVLVWKYWDRVSSVVGGFVGKLGDLASAIPGVQPAFEFLGDIGSKIGEGFGVAMSKLTEFGAWIGSFFSQEVLTDEQKAAWSQVGADAAQGLVDSAKAVVMSLVEWFKGLPGMILGAVGTIDLSAAFRISPITSPVQGAGGNVIYPVGQAPGVDGERAKGGPVWQGGSFLVGENQPEIFTPRSSGTITPLDKLGVSAGNRTVQVGGVHIHGITDPKAVAQAVNDKLGDLLRGAHSDSEAWA